MGIQLKCLEMTLKKLRSGHLAGIHITNLGLMGEPLQFASISVCALEKKIVRVDSLMVYMEFGHGKSISDHYNTTRKSLGTIRIPSETIRIPLEIFRNH